MKYQFRRQELTTEKVMKALLPLFIMDITHSSIYLSGDKSIKQGKFEFVFKENHRKFSLVNLILVDEIESAVTKALL